MRFRIIDDDGGFYLGTLESPEGMSDDVARNMLATEWVLFRSNKPDADSLICEWMVGRHGWHEVTNKEEEFRTNDSGEANQDIIDSYESDRVVAKYRWPDDAPRWGGVTEINSVDVVELVSGDEFNLVCSDGEIINGNNPFDHVPSEQEIRSYIDRAGGDAK